MSETEKESMREVIKRLTTEYLNRGGVITFCPSKYWYPIKSMKWVPDNGMDYSTWSRQGGTGYGYYIQDSVNNGEGSYETRSAPFEGYTHE